MSVGGKNEEHTRRRRRRRGGGGGGGGGKWVVVRRIKTFCAFSTFNARELANASFTKFFLSFLYVVVCIIVPCSCENGVVCFQSTK